MTQSNNNKITRRAYARLGLMGNPTDALGGSALAVAIQDLWAEATLEPSERIRFIEPVEEQLDWENLDALVHTINTMGHHGGRRLILALIHRLIGYYRKHGEKITIENFTLSWKTIIPTRVGLGGSTALLTSTLRVLMEHVKIEIPLLDQVDIVLRTETDDLKIPAGPIDRVAEVFEGLTFYDVRKDGSLEVERLDPKSLPPVFVAIDGLSSEGTEVFHSNLRERFFAGDPAVLEGIQRQTALARQTRDLLKTGRGDEIGPLMNENYDIRTSLVKLNPYHSIMVERARQAGAYAKFAGSGGTIVGTCDPQKMNHVIEKLRGYGYRVFRPAVKEPDCVLNEQIVNS